MSETPTEAREIPQPSYEPHESYEPAGGATAPTGTPESDQPVEARESAAEAPAEGRGGLPLGHLVAGGLASTVVTAGTLYQAAGVAGLVGGGVVAGGAAAAYVRYRRGRKDGKTKASSSGGRGQSSRRGGASTGGRATTSAFRSLGLGGSRRGGRAGAQGGGLLGGLGRRGRMGRLGGLLGGRAAAAGGGIRASRAGVRAKAATGGKGGGSSTKRGAQARVAAAGRQVRQAAAKAAAAGRRVAAAPQGAARAARRAAGWVARAREGRAGRILTAAGSRARETIRQAAIRADRATGRRVSSAYAAAKEGRTWRERCRRAARAGGRAGRVLAPVVATVAALAARFRRKKAKSQAEDARAGEETRQQQEPQERQEAQDVTGQQADQQDLSQPSVHATATCPRCGRQIQTELGTGQEEAVTVCPCGYAVRLFRYAPQAAEPSSTDRPNIQAPTTTERRRHTMHVNPLVSAAAEVTSAAASYAPADMWQVARDLDQLHEVPTHIGMALKTYTMRLQGEYPIDPSVVEALGELYMAHAMLAQRAQEVAVLFKQVHADDLRREEAPRTNEAAWNV